MSCLGVPLFGYGLFGLLDVPSLESNPLMQFVSFELNEFSCFLSSCFHHKSDSCFVGLDASFFWDKEGFCSCPGVVLSDATRFSISKQLKKKVPVNG